ncbi:MAG: hypothetical protein ACPL68_06005, partial [Candidatus Hydrothermia bacterium]
MFIMGLLSLAFKEETTKLGEYGPYANMEGLSGSADGRAWGFKAWKADGKQYVLINGKEWGPYGIASSLVDFSLNFSSDGSAWGFAAEKADGKQYVLINGKEWGPY